MAKTLKRLGSAVIGVFRYLIYLTKDPLDILIDEEIQLENEADRRKATLRVCTRFAERSISYIQENAPFCTSEQVQRLEEKFGMYASTYEKLMREREAYQQASPELFRIWSDASSRLEKLFDDYYLRDLR